MIEKKPPFSFSSDFGWFLSKLITEIKITTMKIIFWKLSFVCVLFICCSEQKEKSLVNDHVDLLLKVPETIVVKSALHYDRKTSVWTLNDQLYSGFAVSYYPDNNLKEKFGILHGKKQNKFVQWHPDGHFKNVADYHKGKLHGEKKIWSSDSAHILIAQLNYHNGKPHGAQKKWYPTGELFKKLNMNNGKEEGIQQAFRKNGALYANYEAKNGRIFGLKKAALCYGLDDENVKYKK
ncbi:toxin-antitoxin system YwqK family antitoxin [uncultured Aquimarina sp.]|uniref:toxin-antitoxin system YwqK family antitoxin n=1 Tax=uncultured Aquimarina sp. TaxID=575652 RepID=UPI0026056C86|nr:toxin-antitoxin system YwqK family antitoxin [uncultured Aquimarina sp.]